MLQVLSPSTVFVQAVFFVRRRAPSGDIFVPTSGRTEPPSLPGLDWTNLLADDGRVVYTINYTGNVLVEIDLGNDKNIAQIKIVNRRDCCKGDMAGAMLLITNVQSFVER